jgi:hypothetical protein
MTKKFISDYVKRLGQWHLTDSSRTDGRALCGMPLLGNNYASVIPEKDRIKCIKCWEHLIAKELKGGN